MPKFSQRSLDRLATCHPDLQRLMLEVIKQTDFMVLVGFRNKEDQDAAVAAGNSQTPWPTSKHNKRPALAVDIAPWPIDFDNRERFFKLAGHVLATAHFMGINVKWGGEWRTLQDTPHYELVED